MGIYDAEVRALARSQHGIISRPQLLGLGQTHGAISGALRRGRLERIHTGTYRFAGSTIPPEQRLMAATVRCRPQAWLTGPTALALLQVEGMSLADEVVVVVPADRTICHVPFTTDARDLPSHLLAEVRGIRVTSVAASLVYARPLLGADAFRAAVDSAKWRGLLHNHRLRSAAELLTDLEGSSLVLHDLDAGLFDQESVGERNLVPVIGDLDPRPGWQVWIAPDIRVDAALADVPVILEYLGEQHHDTPRQRAADAVRDRRIRELGYVPIYVRKADLRTPGRLRERVLGIREGLLAAGTTSPRHASPPTAG